MKKILATLSALVLTVVVAGTAYAALGTEGKVTGRAIGEAGGVQFEQNIFAEFTKENGFRGKMDYRRTNQSVPDLYARASVRCVSFWDNQAVSVGPVEMEDDPANLVADDDWMMVSVHDGGPKGEGDRMRVRFLSREDAKNYCLNGPDSFPGVVVEGNYKVSLY